MRGALPQPSRSAAQLWGVRHSPTHSQSKTVMVVLGLDSIPFPQQKRDKRKRIQLVKKNTTPRAERCIDDSTVFHILSTALLKVNGKIYSSSIKFKHGLYDFLGGQFIFCSTFSFSSYLSTGIHYVCSEIIIDS